MRRAGSCDIRKTNPYSIYQELDFEQVVMHEGDAMARFKVRMKEIEESAKIIAQLIDNIPDGEIQAKVSKVFKLPAGHWFRTVEGCRGAFGVYLESDGTVNPYRIKLVPPCLLKRSRCRSSDTWPENSRPHHYRRFA